MEIRVIRPPLSMRLALAATLVVMLVGGAQADTVASLLGNFTINQYCAVSLSAAAVDVHYVVVFGQMPALRELHAADADANGVTTQAERDAYMGGLAARIAAELDLRVDDAAVALRPVRWTSSLPTEQGGFSLRADLDFSAPLPPSDVPRIHALTFANRSYPGRRGWHEIVVQAAPGVAVFDTNAFDTSATAALTEALKALPESGPLDERDVHLRFATSGAPPGAVLLGPRGSGSAPLSGSTPQVSPGGVARDADWIGTRTHAIATLIANPRLDITTTLWALLAALVLGAVHALSPGHGKTVVGAYLIGSRGTPRHALFLAFTVTATHTIGVFVLGFATLYASRSIVPERLFPVLSLISALLILGMGIVLLVQRMRAANQAWHPAASAGGTRFVALTPSHAPVRRLALAPSHGADLGWHSHGGGSLHSHLPPGAAGERVTWRSLAALGISGGLVPCPSAMVLLLAAIAVNKTGFGMLLVLVFSLGLAATLTIVGLVFLYARQRFRRNASPARWPLVIPVLSALTITAIGAALCISAVQGFG